ncbi:MAG: periplasmic heavy metal sensor [Pseudomonadales bacterium]|nr:periplasmic heavy metal sensor [Pseudomonadales bacterium]
MNDHSSSSGIATRSKKKQRLLTILLAISLALNLLIAGAFIGFQLRRNHHERPMPQHMRWITRSLDENTRRVLIPIIESYAETTRPLRHDLHQARRNFSQAITQPNLNDEQITHASDELQQASHQMQSNMHLQLVVIMKQLSAEERMKAMQFLQRRVKRQARPEHRKNTTQTQENFK